MKNKEYNRDYGEDIFLPGAAAVSPRLSARSWRPLLRLRAVQDLGQHGAAAPVRAEEAALPLHPPRPLPAPARQVGCQYLPMNQWT